MRAAAVIALVLMFFLSGLNKTMTFQSTVRALESKGWTVAPPLFIPRPTRTSYMANGPFLSNVSLVGGLTLLLVDSTPA